MGKQLPRLWCSGATDLFNSAYMPAAKIQWEDRIDHSRVNVAITILISNNSIQDEYLIRVFENTLCFGIKPCHCDVRCEKSTSGL